MLNIADIIIIILQFSKTFLLDYCFEEVQYFKFIVYDVDDRKHIDDVRRLVNQSVHWLILSLLESSTPGI